MKTIVIMLLVIGIAVGMMLNASEFYDEDIDAVEMFHNVFDEVESTTVAEPNWINGLALAFVYVAKVFCWIGYIIAGMIGFQNSWVLIAIVVFWLFWYPVAWLCCLIGILVKDKFRKEVRT